MKSQACLYKLKYPCLEMLSQPQSLVKLLVLWFCPVKKKKKKPNSTSLSESILNHRALIHLSRPTEQHLDGLALYKLSTCPELMTGVDWHPS